MRVFKTKWFRRFARREGLSDEVLCGAIARANCGQVDANLGAGIIKQRIARPGQGRSGGYRGLIVFRHLDRAIFVFGFAKNQTDNIEPGELEDLKSVAALLLGYSQHELDEAVDNEELWEIACDDEEIQE